MKTKKPERNPLDYEDFGSPWRCLISVPVVVLAFIVFVVFGLFVGGIIQLVAGLMK